MTTTFIILGGAGDLAQRLLIPGIAEYVSTHGADITIVGAGRHEHDDYRTFVREAAAAVDDEVAERLAASAEFVVADATDREDLRNLLEGRSNVVLYFALSPAIAVDSIRALKDAELAEDITLAMEKPFGADADDARELNQQLLDLVDEEQIFRVDHFLATSGTLNFKVLRSTNRLIASSWSNEDVESIRLVYNETVALEGRAEFYESTGAAEDMLQSHLLQTLARILADEGTSPEEILRAIRPTDEVRRGRYTEGEVDGERVPSYVDEDGVDPDNGTETWFRVVVDVDTEKWRGVPITLESGKAFGEDVKQIEVTFKRSRDNPNNTLTLAFDTEDVEITLNAADPASEDCAQITLHTDLAPVRMSAYGRVVKGILERIDHLAIPADAAELGWDVMEAIAQKLHRARMEEYPAGTVAID